ncbi:MAG: nucleotidyltransferase domain-containing protein [Nitrospirae bacterium]|nr:nucleotidyltransferase domain-containing protein [Nitrospirota bacterium]
MFAEHKVRLAYLFGSLASSGFGNDVDIAVLMDGNNLSGLSLDLQDFLGTWRLDLVNLGSAPVRIAFEVISTGRLIHSCGADVENAFEMNVIKKYQDSRPLNSRRLIRLRENFRVGIAA